MLFANSDPATAPTKAKKALTRCPRAAGWQLGLLLLSGDLGAAANLLSQAPGLGWSSDDHPGHVVFPSFAVLLANGTVGKVSDTLLADLESTSRDPMDVLSPDDVEGRPKLVAPSIVALIQDVASGMTLADVDRNALIDAMRIAAEKRADGILGSSRRRHYGHAAMLAGQCVAVAPAARRKDLSAWLMGLRHTYSRRHAFTQELKRAMESLGVSPTE